MTRKRKKTPTRNRMMWGQAPEGRRRLWDADGREWEPINEELSRQETVDLLRRSDVKVGIYRYAAELVWIAPEDKAQVWKMEIDPNMHDRAVKGRAKLKGDSLPYVPTLWRSGDDLLLLFDDFD